MIQLIDDQRDAWAVAEDVAGFIGTSQAMLWRELVIEDIEDGSKARARRVDVLRCLPCDSWPSHVHERGFFFEFEPSRGVPRSRGSREARTLSDAIDASRRWRRGGRHAIEATSRSHRTALTETRRAGPAQEAVGTEEDREENRTLYRRLEEHQELHQHDPAHRRSAEPVDAAAALGTAPEGHGEGIRASA